MSKRIDLEPLQVDHAVEMASVLADAELYHYTGGEAPSLVDLTRRYTAMVAGSGSPDEQWVNWVVRLTATGEAIGFVQATVEPTGADLAWTIGQAWQRNGYASEAALAMQQLLKDQGVTVFGAWIHPDHVASHKVAQTLGLSLTDEVDEDGEHRWSNSDFGVR